MTEQPAETFSQVRHDFAMQRLMPLLNAYAEHWEGDDSIILAQLLADLRHFADAHGVDFAEADRDAYSMYCEDISLTNKPT